MMFEAHIKEISHLLSPTPCLTKKSEIKFAWDSFISRGLRLKVLRISKNKVGRLQLASRQKRQKLLLY